MIDELRWKAVAERNSRLKEPFIYAVKSTGIYCLPGCASRQPKRENVAFFNTAAEALMAGFRPCRRCRPDENFGSDTETEKRFRDCALAAAACRRIEGEEKEPSLDTLAADSGLSAGYFQRLFKKVVGLSPHEYSTAIRSSRFLQTLKEESSVTAAIYEAGYSSPSRAYEEFKGQSSLSPAEHQRGGRGLSIAYAVAPCHLGWAIIAHSSRGLCGVMFDDKPHKLPELLAERFPEAELKETAATSSELIRRALKGIDDFTGDYNLPLDIIGTAFQKIVWNALREIPPGETASYGEIAERIGKPKAYRAVANACGENRVALYIPCHRIIRSDGSLGGYRWGTARKKQILQEEGAGGFE